LPVLPAVLLAALPLALLLLLPARAGSTRPGTIASATLPRARLLGLNFTTSRLLPVMSGTSFSCSRQGGQRKAEQVPSVVQHSIME
jgi:hypothetical protein